MYCGCVRARVFRGKKIQMVITQIRNTRARQAPATGYTSNGAPLVEVRLPVEQSIVFELVLTALCFVSCSSSACFLLHMSLKQAHVISAAHDSLIAAGPHYRCLNEVGTVTATGIIHLGHLTKLRTAQSCRAKSAAGKPLHG